MSFGNKCKCMDAACVQPIAPAPPTGTPAGAFDS